MGVWTLYGLGTENQSLPGFVSLTPPSGFGGATNYGSSFLPAIYQGTRIGQNDRPMRYATVTNRKLNDNDLQFAMFSDALQSTDLEHPIMKNNDFPALALILCYCVNGLVGAGELDSRQLKWHSRYKTQENAPKPEEMLLNTDAEPNLSDGFTSLFNGQDLHGWIPKGGTSRFEVRDGLLVGVCVPGSSSTYLCTEQADFTDFIFTCDMKWEVDCNSGVMFRAQSRPGKDDTETVFGPQGEMEGFSQDRHWSGGIYGQSCGGYFYPLWLKEHEEARAATKEGEWNRLTISAEGSVVKTWINGIPVAHWVDDGSYPRGFFGLQIHKGVKGTVLWRNIRVKQLAN